MNKGFALFLATSAAILATGTAALAQDNSTFTGPRVEALVGYDITRPGSSVDIDNADDLDQSIEDITYGVGVGYVEAGRDLYVGARAGILATPNTLVYAKGGYTNAQFDLLATDNSTDTETDLDLDGWRAGAGVEHALSENLFVKGEYRYSNYEEGEVEAPSGLESDRFDVDMDRHQILMGVGYRF